MPRISAVIFMRRYSTDDHCLRDAFGSVTFLCALTGCHLL
jgi:hypothetical protein